MNILLIYSTYSSNTFTVAHIIKNELEKYSHHVTLKQAHEAGSEEILVHDLVLIGSPSWKHQGKEGHPHQHIIEFMEKSTSVTFNQRPFAVFGLGDRRYAQFCGAVDHLENFIHSRQGKLLSDSLRIHNFYFNEEKNTHDIQEWVKKLLSKI